MAEVPPIMKEIMGFESSQLCFNKEDFFKDEFSVDAFVLRYRQQSGLENLRTDLGVYLKVLRSSMIDLINRDYADFVNLSSNLVGLDASIGKLEMPLGQLREEVLSVRRSFDDLLEQTEWRLSRLHEVRAQKQYLRLLGALPGYLDRLEALLSTAAEQDGDALERAASEHNQLLYALQHCAGAALAAQLRPRADRLAAQLAARLQDALIAALQQKDADKLAHVLRIFATLDQVSVAESLFRERVVEPYMDEVISPSALRDSPRGLRGLLENVLRFIPEQAQLLVTVTRHEHGAQTGPRYDFLVNAVWPCVIQKLDDELPVIYAPGNPNTFFECYSASLEFVESFEAACGSKASVTRLRKHEAYDRFMKRWNLPVYYQIRFQEIGGALEEALGAAVRGGSGSVSGAAAAWTALQRCWDRRVFLRPLTHRFWQLCLQVVARYCTSVQARLDAEAPPTPDQCVALLTELVDLSGRLGTLLETLVVPTLPDLPEDALSAMRASLATGTDRLSQLRPRLIDCYTSQLLAAATSAMRAVTDIPRLYRRTNRDAPTAPSAYVAAMVAPLSSFAEETCAGLERQLVAEYLAGVVTQLCTQYAERVGQVLTSVQRMEESLRKLKRPRASAAAPAGATDDDKIRSQLRLDVTELGQRLEALQLRPEEVAEYAELKSLVTEAQAT